MSKPRNEAHKGLPKGWRFSYGSYRYRVPKGQEHYWDGKTQFTLGKTLAEARSAFNGRMLRAEGAIKTFGELFDRYLFEVMPTKAIRTQTGDIRQLKRLREMIGTNDVKDWKSVHAYQLRDAIAQKSTKGSKGGKITANRLMALLKHSLTKAIEWGVIEDHPMTNLKFKMFPIGQSTIRIPTFEEVEEALKIAPPTIRAFVNISLLTGLRVTDTLQIKLSDITPDCLTVHVSKTRNKAPQTLVFEITSELKEAIDLARTVKPAAYLAKVIGPLSAFLFHTKYGKCYLNDAYEFPGFDSMWKRWQRKLPQEKRFCIRSLRNLNGHQGDLAEASERLGHSSPATTKKFYRSNVNNVVPLSLKKPN